MKTFALCAAMALALSTSAFAQSETTSPPEAEATAPETAVEQTAASETAPESQTPQQEAAPPAAAAVSLPTGISAPPEGKGQIVFFRPNRFVGAALSFTVRESEQDLGRLPNARYFVHAAEPGVHEYEIGRNDTLRLEIEPGTTYYVIQSTQLGIVAGRAVISPSDQTAFEAALPRMRLWEPRN